MIFSKSFGYAVRGVLYIAKMQDTRPYVQAEEIAVTLGVPRHFVSKILKKLVKAGILTSSKGKTGGFSINQGTARYSLLQLFELTDGFNTFHNCSLRMQACNSNNPCPMHRQMEEFKGRLQKILAATFISDLLKNENEDFIRSITTTKPTVN